MKKLTLCISVLFMLLGLSSMSAFAPVAATSFAGGDGSSANPWQISNFAELQYFSAYASEKQEYFILTADIDASVSKDVAGGYPTVSLFQGQLDGNGFEIDSLVMNEKSFITKMKRVGTGPDYIDVIIKDLGFTNVNVKALDNTEVEQKNLGGICGFMDLLARVERCFVTGSVYGRQSVGGITGNIKASAKITDCYVSGTVLRKNAMMTTHTSGIAGVSSGGNTIENCFFNGTSRNAINSLNDKSGVTYTNCYYVDTCTLDAALTDQHATSLTVTDMADATKYSGWDFTSVWEIVNGMPALRKPKRKMYTGNVCYVSNGGDDANIGTIDAPYRTIAEAMSLMNYGDTCCIRGGVYRETVNVDKGNSCIKAYNNEEVVITGCDLIENWELVEGNLYKAYAPQPVSQFFHNGVRSMVATYPNIDADYHIMDNWHSSVSDNNGETSFVTLGGEDFAADYWTGGHYVGKNSGTTSGNSNGFKAARGIISSSLNDTLFLTNDNVKAKDANVATGGVGKGFVINHKNALDIAGEWYYENDTVYYITDGTAPSACEARTRNYVIEMQGLDKVSLLGLNIKAGAINMADATNCLIDSCSVRYIAPFSAYGDTDWESETDGSRGVYVSGSNNTITNSYFGASWTACVTLDGENQTIDNCLLENGNWVGSRLALLSVHGDSCVVTNNTLRHSTRDGIEAGNGSWLNKIGVALTIEHNLIYSTNTRHTDGGCFYSNHQQSNIALLANTVVSHNWMKVDSDKYGVKKRKYTGAFYPDNYSSGYTGKYNLILDTYAGIKSNAFDQPSTDNCFYNNTMKGVSNAGQGTGYTSFKELSNNLSNKTVSPENDSIPIILRNNITYTDASSEFIVGDYWDFRTKATSEAIDAAVVIDGVTPSSNPDAGCYEYGVPAWIAGCDFDTPTFDDEPSYSTPLDIPVLSSATLSEDKLSVTILWDNNSSDIEAIAVERKEAHGDWVRVGTVLSDVETYTDTYLVSENVVFYRLRSIKDDDISSPSNNVEIVWDVPTSIDDNDSNQVLSSKYTIHPNPASNYFTIITANAKEVSVLNFNGTTVLAPVMVNGRQTISVASLAGGVYLVKVDNDLTKLIVL